MMHEQCVVGVYSTFADATATLQALEAANHPADQVSFVAHSVTDEVPREEELQFGDDTGKGVAKGASAGGLLGLLLGAPLLAIPGIGPALLAGPLATGMTGAIVGGFLGAMGGWGVHTDHVRQNEDEVRKGKLLIVASGDPRQVAEAKRILDASHAEEVHLHAATSADAHHVDDRPA